MAKHGYHTVLFGHFGQGCMHNRLDPDLQTVAGIENFGAFLDEAGDLVVRYGGSLSGEHGDGQLRANQLGKMYGPELVRAFAEFKRIFDPDGRMNPGKVVAPYHPTQNLRLGSDYRPSEVTTHFAYPSDEKGFADAVNRCFGIGKCRHASGGTMCPSFMVTREEQHSTRGRARLLFEMMSGHLRAGGWRDPHVKQALDLCLSCKGCKGDCPVSVDIATYKAEFLAHYYAGRIRPRQAYALGLIPVWARLAAHAPGLVNAALAAPVAGRAAKLAAGADPHRSAPAFARQTFRSWFAGHRGPTAGQPVLLWPDTFTNYFTPEVGIAAVEVLEDAGYRVEIPRRPLCCGRPLYDYGMLPTAKRWLRHTLTEMREPLEAGWPVIGLEPSCLAVFRDELPNMFPADLDAKRLAGQSRTLGEFLAEGGYRPPGLHRQALVQVHCHQGAVLTHDSERQLLERMGLELTIPDSGCCGMAGSFGYEHGQRYEVSQACGERVILPAVRDAPRDTLIIADGFSCREQIAQATDRRPVHLAQVLRLAASAQPPDAFPESSAWQQRPRSNALLTMQLGDFLTCVQHGLPVKIIVISNNTLGLIKWEQMVFLGNPEYGVNMAPFDFVKFAEACGARGVRIDDPKLCGQQIAEALAWDGPAIIECVTDEHEPPYPAKVKKDQAQKLVTALREGTPNRRRIALQMVKDMLDESSFDASPAHRVPGPVGKAAAKVADKLQRE